MVIYLYSTISFIIDILRLYKKKCDRPVSEDTQNVTHMQTHVHTHTHAHIYTILVINEY
jgi:hypothetical protein